MLINHDNRYFAMPREVVLSPLLTLEEKGLMSFLYSMSEDFTADDVRLLCDIPVERMEELMDSLTFKGFLVHESGYRLFDGGTL